MFTIDYNNASSIQDAQDQVREALDGVRYPEGWLDTTEPVLSMRDWAWTYLATVQGVLVADRDDIDTVASLLAAMRKEDRVAVAKELIEVTAAYGFTAMILDAAAGCFRVLLVEWPTNTSEGTPDLTAEDFRALHTDIEDALSRYGGGYEVVVER